MRRLNETRKREKGEKGEMECLLKIKERGKEEMSGLLQIRGKGKKGGGGKRDWNYFNRK